MSWTGRDNTPPRPELPRLQEVEAEGKEATQELARTFVRETLRHGGRIDLVRLERAGPSVQAAYQHLLAQVALRGLGPRKPATKGERPVGERKEDEATEPAALPPANAGDSANTSADLPRTEKGWRDQRRPLPGFKAAARRRGQVAGVIITAAALSAVALFRL